MIAHRCLGLTSRGLMTYLAALGLAKVISEQADPDVRFGWTGDTFVLRTAVPDLAEFLVRDYRPRHRQPVERRQRIRAEGQVITSSSSD